MDPYEFEDSLVEDSFVSFVTDSPPDHYLHDSIIESGQIEDSEEELGLDMWAEPGPSRYYDNEGGDDGESDDDVVADDDDSESSEEDLWRVFDFDEGGCLEDFVVEERGQSDVSEAEADAEEYDYVEELGGRHGEGAICP